MINLCVQNQNSIINKIKNNNIDNVALSESNLADDIILSMYDKGVLSCLKEAIEDKRAKNTVLPFDLILTLSIAAKMKVKTSISDIPYAITDHRVLSKLGYNIVDTNGNLKDELMKESSIRFLLGKYTPQDVIESYNNCVQNYILPKIDAQPNIHILDCTNLEVNLKNYNYEGSEVALNKDGVVARGYKLGTLRGIVGDTGVIEEICFGDLKTHDLELTREMIASSPVFNNGDILIEDRGFMDRKLINFLKSKREVDTYVPLRDNMDAYIMAVSTAKTENIWEDHPTRVNQKIALVTGLKRFWQSENPEEDVDLVAAVGWDLKDNKYFVFVTTDTSKSARDIILTYELRPEIEEDYRQLKDFWNLDEFKSTKLNMIAFHIITILFGYLFFQIFTLLPEGEQYSHKSLPVVLKNYKPKKMPYFIFYANNEFGIFSISEIIKLYPSCNMLAKQRLLNILE